MTPTRAFIDAITALVAADTNFLAQPSTFVQVALIAGAFTPSPDLVLGDLTLAARTGLEPIHAASAATQVGTDPATGQSILQVREPAGGWHWITTDDTEPAETIRGYALLNSAGNALFATQPITPPVTFHADTDGETLDIASVRFTNVGNYIQ